MLFAVSSLVLYVVIRLAMPFFSKYVGIESKETKNMPVMRNVTELMEMSLLSLNSIKVTAKAKKKKMAFLECSAFAASSKAVPMAS